MIIKHYKKSFFHILAAIFSLVLSEISFLRHNDLWGILKGLIVIVMFYIHALVLVPWLLKKQKINNYILLTFGLFALGAVLLAIFSVAASRSYIYDFTLILEKGIAYSDTLRRLYEAKYFLSLLVFGVSFAYGYLVSNTKDKLSYLGSLIFRMKSTEFLFHVVFLVVLSVTSYFMGFFLNNIMLGCVLLFYFHMLIVRLFLLKSKKLNLFVLLSLIATFVFARSITELTNLQLGITISIGVTVITFATIYSLIKHQFREQKSLFTKKEVELQQLKSQINPHFLFNALNTLYSFAIKEEAENTASNIKKFSNLIRFSINDLKNDFIPLEKEIGYIKDYIDIQRSRFPAQQNIKLNFENYKEYKIAPMLLIPFVENAFKHGINPHEESTLIINLRCNIDTVFFECINSIKKQSQNDIVEDGFGIGIKNVKSRLSLIYPERHHFSINKEDNLFKVKIEIYDNSHSN